MITASLVLYKTSVIDVETIIRCSIDSIIDKLFVVDNSPTDDLRSIVEDFDSPKLVYSFGHGNVGYGTANNIAISQSIKLGARYHIVLNPDLIFEPSVIESLQIFMENHENVGYVIPKTLGSDGQIRPICRRIPSPMDIFAVRLLPKSLAKKQIAKYKMQSVGYDEVRNVPILSGCFMFLRVETLKKVGLFDERFFMYFEDFDLMRRIYSVSQNIYYPKVSIIHNHGDEHRKSKKMFWISMKSAVKYFCKWGWVFDLERWRVNRRVLDDCNRILEEV